MEVYEHENIRRIKELHASSLAMLHEGVNLGGFLKVYAGELESSFKNYSDGSFTELSNYYPSAIGKAREEVFSMSMGSVDFLDAAACVFGFPEYRSDLEKVEIDPEYEILVDLLLAGQLEEFGKVLGNKPGLVNQSSSFGHRAQLIHYCSSNAVEIHRQVVPLNIVDLIKTLLIFGADPYSKIPVYGGKFDFMELFSTSAHPIEAGIAYEVRNLF